MEHSAIAQSATPAPAAAPGQRFRWTVCALLFFATTVNYADRQILGLLAPLLQKELGWSEADYGLIVTAFQAAYALGLMGAGRLIDLVGTRIGYLLVLGWWSGAAVLHGLASTVLGFGGARFLLGLGEAGNFPAAVKTVAEWFPERERALATGLFNSGSNVGAIVTALAVPWLALHFGWRSAFVLLGGTGVLWMAAWFLLYREPARREGEPAADTVPWRALIGHRAVWALAVARFLTDPVWWFYLYWAPKFLNAQFGLKLDQLGLPVAVMYLVSNAGGVLGGWLSSRLMRRGRPAPAARKRAMLVCALLVVPIVLAPRVPSAWAAVGLLSLAMAGHQGWAANIFTIVSDLFPKRAVGTVVGICGFGGAVGGMLVANAVGLTLQATGSYTLIFALAGGAYLAAVGIVYLVRAR